MDCVESYIAAKNEIMKQFECQDDFYIKAATGYSWRIKDADGSSFLAYWKNGEKINECVVVRSGGKPMIIKKKKYTLVVCIECVKVAIILKNSNNM